MLIQKDSVVIFHVGINDIEKSVKTTPFMNSIDRKRMVDEVSNNMNKLIDLTLERQPYKVIWSKCLPHFDNDINDMLHAINVKVHNNYLDNEQVILCENNPLSFRGKFPNKKFFRDSKHLNENGIKICASNLLQVVNSVK